MGLSQGVSYIGDSNVAVRLSYVWKWKELHIPRIVKLMDLAEMAKLMALIKEKTLPRFISTWKSLLDFLLENER